MSISTGYSILYSIACLLLGLSYAYFLYRRENLLTSSKLKWILFSLRTILVSVLAVLLLNPIVKSENQIIQKPIVVLAQDNSSSISDTNTLSLLTDISSQLSEFEVYKFSFSDKVDEGFSKNNTGLLSNYSNLFSDINSRFENQNISAVVIASDGLYNAGSNPLHNSFKYPIYTLAQGDTTIKKDVGIVKVSKNDIAFLDNMFPLEVSISTKQCKGKSIGVHVWNNGKKIQSKNIVVDSNNSFDKVNFSIQANNVGLQNYLITTTKDTDEENIINNNYNAYIDVIDSKYKLLFLTNGVHPDVAAYKSVIDKNKNYTIDKVDISEFEGSYNSYQLVVLFGIDKGEEKLKGLINENIPVLVFDFQKNTHEDFTSSFSFVEKGGIEEVLCYKNELFSSFTFSPNLINLLENSPPLKTSFGTYNLKTGVDVVLNQRVSGINTDLPVIIIDEKKGRKKAFVMAEGFWSWKLYDYQSNNNNIAFDELFTKLTQYLVLIEDKTKFRLNYEKQVAENSIVYFGALLYNESYELINNKNVSIVITNDKGEDFNFSFSKLENKYFLDIGVLDAGKYTFKAKVEGSDLIKEGSFEVKSIQLENLCSVANHQFLHQLSSISGGKLFFPNQKEELVNHLVTSESNYKLISTEERLKGIINIPWILLSLLSLISLEWFLRKYNGLI